ncbi:hypothetical protein [Cellulomonas iranensis]|uniref:hypothetical protein n=1 Tax=Cellulomonas iranensis TaxID=76862 RepID=UPI000B3C4B83|nr:hypothetical protein [Cellulomonas iranensis]
MTDLPPPPPGATRIDFRGGATPLLTVGVALAALLAVGCGVMLAGPLTSENDDPTTIAVARVVLICGVLLFGAVALGGVVTLRNLRRPAGLLVDHDGLDWWQGHDRVRLASWDEVGAVAVSYMRKPVALSAGAAIGNALIGVQGWSLEIWTREATLGGRSRRLLHVPADPAPVDGLPPVRYRLFLAPSPDVARATAEAVAAAAPQRWIGTVERPWNPAPGS